MPIDADTTISSLRAVGCDVEIADESLVVTAPSWRPDLTDPADLVEEVIRLIGYDHPVAFALRPCRAWTHD